MGWSVPATGTASLPAATRKGLTTTKLGCHGTVSCIGVEVFRSIDQPLLGMELLEGSRVTVEAWDGGDVIIDEDQP